MLVALRKPTVSELTSLKDSTSVNTAQFSIRRVERVNSKGKRVDRRQHSDAFEVRNLLWFLLVHSTCCCCCCCILLEYELLGLSLEAAN